MDTEMEDFHNSSYSTPPKRNVLLLPAPEDDDDELQVATTTTTVPTKRKRHASGLGNLGNTCFMNSTIQCLAHSDPLCRYFLSNQYTQDLNRQNPLGTGGELALQFASLLQEMWSSTYGTVYPRSFKTALGKHAEQFMGYDQHDSQEFALYLLDALHEDTNRVTQKPYIEKPEQGQDETDEQAAEVAWKLHLQREDSKVLDYFMGQVKSRVTCPTPGCGRVSTTFDPFMYLSVPIPGSSERTIPVTLVTLENGSYTFSVTIQKLATMETLLEMVVHKYNKAHAITTTKQLVMEDLIIVDVHNSHVYAHRELHHSVDTIRNHDVTRIYQLTPVDDIQRQEQECKRGNPNTLAIQALESSTKSHSSHVLDIATLKELNVGETWIDVLSRYTHGSPRKFDCLLNPKRSSHEDRVEFYQKLQGFIELCHLTSDGGDDDDDDDAEMTLSDENPQEDTKASTLPSLQERSQSSNMFQHVNTVQDLAKLEFCSKQFRKHALKLLEASTTKYENGIVIEIVMRRKRHARIVSYGDDQNFSVPLLLRVPSNMTVYGLREELARRLGKYLKTEHLEHHDSKPKPPPPAPCSDDMMDIKLEASNVTPDESNAGSDHQSDAALPMEESSSERTSAASPNKSSSLSSSFDFGSPDLLIMRQIPLTYRRDTFKSRINAIPRQLGMLNTFDLDGGQPMTLANKDDDAEQHTIAELVGDHGRVELNWSEELCKQVFDMQLYEASETVDDPDQKAKAVDKKITVKDCIDKYCHMEQLDESEMWYCNRCKDHVRAWKQFHLYRSPPILIVHLKRFQYSQSTHRRDKIDTFIDFPLEGLDLTNEFTQWTEETKPIYDCYAVSNHFGGLGGGHYTAFALSDDGTWTDFDDSRVTTDVDPKDVVSAAAYVLYYRRRDVVLDGLDEDMDLAVPAIVQDSFYQPAEDHAPIIDFNSLENRMDDDRSIENEVQSTAASSSGSIKTVENEDPFVGSGTFQETLEEFKSTSPSQ